jgi:hypothetical protein
MSAGRWLVSLLSGTVRREHKTDASGPTAPPRRPAAGMSGLCPSARHQPFNPTVIQTSLSRDREDELVKALQS